MWWNAAWWLTCFDKPFLWDCDHMEIPQKIFNSQSKNLHKLWSVWLLTVTSQCFNFECNSMFSASGYQYTRELLNNVSCKFAVAGGSIFEWYLHAEEWKSTRGNYHGFCIWAMRQLKCWRTFLSGQTLISAVAYLRLALTGDVGWRGRRLCLHCPLFG